MQNSGYYNRPIIIGAGQITHREKIRRGNTNVYELIRQAVDICARDTGQEDILQKIDMLGVVSIVSEHKESPLPGVCKACGITPAIQEETVISGTSPQMLVNRAASRIMQGKIKLALLTGGEALYQDIHFLELLNLDNYYKRYDTDARVAGDTRRWEKPNEILHGLDRPPHLYPLFDTALRAHLGMQPQAYRELLNTYFTSLASVVRGNEYAWFNTGKASQNIAEPTDTNPIYNYPYTRFMNPVLQVNQAASLIMTDTDTAMQLGIPREKWVYLCSGVEATDTWFVTDRRNFHSSPVARLTCQAALDTAGLSLADMNFFDLYSCFPCAPLISALELGMELDNLPQITITGGLPYFGGPGSNYNMHSIAHAVGRLRQNPKEYGFITAWGSYLTKHAVGIYSGTQPQAPWRDVPTDPIRREIESNKGPRLCEQPQGAARIETYTVIHAGPKENPMAIIIARLENDERCLALSNDPKLTSIMEQDEFVGQCVQVKPGGKDPNRFSL